MHFCRNGTRLFCGRMPFQTNIDQLRTPILHQAEPHERILLLETRDSRRNKPGSQNHSKQPLYGTAGPLSAPQDSTQTSATSRRRSRSHSICRMV